MAYDRKTEYARLKEKCRVNNLCINCRNLNDRTGSLCTMCLERTKSKRKSLHASRKSIGLCKCGNTPRIGYKECGKCAEAGRKERQLTRDKWTLNGLCINCGAIPIPNKTVCQKCMDKVTNKIIQQYSNRKANKLCVGCNIQLKETEKLRCQNCKIIHNQHVKNQWFIKRNIVLQYYGGKCICCGESKYEFLEIDHINNNGSKHRKDVGRHIIEWIIKNGYPTDLQILCANCNRCKGRFGSCQHTETIQELSAKCKRRLKIIQYYGGKCICCNESNWAFLEFDHVNDDGSVHRKTVKNILKWIIDNNYPSSIQLLCCNCNKAKGLYGKCPHST